ncbi:unnamed protein product [Paramecium pentaurelia]|uniref:Uncharacterized protein n=1 Tax=Paramecium pentaurelia TaxID=43138 RepID=A0A8S1RY48_9CILI|nr:unnamed protein product [Paramecium pentaurelia]
MKKSIVECDLDEQIADEQTNLNERKDQLIIQHNKIKQTIQHFCDQTYISSSININPSKIQIMNAAVYEDLMSYIANFVNQQDMNLVLSLSSIDHQSQNRLQNYTLKHSIIIEFDQKLQQELLQTIEKILIHVGEKIEQICINAYLHGDQNLNNELQVLLNQYMNIL